MQVNGNITNTINKPVNIPQVARPVYIPAGIQVSSSIPYILHQPVIYPNIGQYNNVASVQVYNQPQVQPQQGSIFDTQKSKSIFAQFVTSVKPAVQPEQQSVWKNDLRKLFKENNAVIYALVMRTFNAKDLNNNGLIEEGESSGTFINAIERLDELKKYGINTLHLLPIHPPGKKNAFGNAGSIYAPADFLSIDPLLRDPKDPSNLKEQAKKFIKECHKRGIRVMLDLPSCASVDFYEKHPEMMAKEFDINALRELTSKIGKPELMNHKGSTNELIEELKKYATLEEIARVTVPKIPQGWQDIRMFEPWADRGKRILNESLIRMHEQYIDFCLDLGIDGIRADVGRSKPPEFWDRMIKYTRSKDPDFAFLAESYVYEDASPMRNMPKDRPADLLNVGFDSYYGQYHIFHEWKKAKEFHENMIFNLQMTQKLNEPDKSLIGSFATHDDKSPISNGGVIYCNLTTGLQSTLPMTNPYFVTGFESGDRYIYSYKDQVIDGNTDTDCKEYVVHSEKLDIFNLSRRPGGDHPEIGDYMTKMMQIRGQYNDIITKGSYIPLEVKGNKDDLIIAYARHYKGRTLLIIANKDVCSRQTGKIAVPTLKDNQELKDISPSYGIPSQYAVNGSDFLVDLGPGRFHMFEINTQDIEKNSKEVYRQKITNATTVA